MRNLLKFLLAGCLFLTTASVFAHDDPEKMLSLTLGKAAVNLDLSTLPVIQKQLH